MSKNVLRAGQRGLSLYEYSFQGDSTRFFVSISQAIKETGIPRKVLTDALNLRTPFSYKDKMYTVHDLTPTDYEQLMERQQKDARERAKCTGHGQ